MLAQSVSKRFAKDLSPFGKDISAAMMENMLPMTEYTGQLRGLGSGIAAKGKITKENMENLMALMYQLQTFNKKLQDNMLKIIAKYPKKMPKEISTELSTIDKNVKDYITLTQKRLLKHPDQVDSDDYFDKGTDLINSIIKAYNTSNKAIMEDSKGWF